MDLAVTKPRTYQLKQITQFQMNGISEMRAILTLTIGLLTPPAVFAGEAGKHADLAEIRIGMAFYDTGLLTNYQFDGPTFNAEFLMASPEFLGPVGRPRPYIGVDYSGVDHPINFGYAGLTWDYHLTSKLFVSGSVGGSVNDAKDLKSSATTRSLGSNLGFHLGAAIGYDISPTLAAQIYTNHFSNAYLAPPNEGHDSSGFRLGYRF